MDYSRGNFCRALGRVCRGDFGGGGHRRGLCRSRKASPKPSGNYRRVAVEGKCIPDIKVNYRRRVRAAVLLAKDLKVITGTRITVPQLKESEDTFGRVVDGIFIILIVAIFAGWGSRDTRRHLLSSCQWKRSEKQIQVCKNSAKNLMLLGRNNFKHALYLNLVDTYNQTIKL